MKKVNGDGTATSMANGSIFHWDDSIEKDMENRRLEYENNERIKRMAKWMEMCPDDYLETNWEDERLKPYIDDLKRVLNWHWQKGKGIWIAGNTGCGKSRSMFELCRRLFVDEKRTSMEVIKGQEFVNKFGACLSNRRGEAQLEDWIDRLNSVRILFIDDFGNWEDYKGRIERIRATVYAIIDSRFSNSLPTLVTTQFKMEDIAQQFQERIAAALLRRINEGFNVIDLRDKVLV